MLNGLPYSKLGGRHNQPRGTAATDEQRAQRQLDKWCVALGGACYRRIDPSRCARIVSKMAATRTINRTLRIERIEERLAIVV